MVSGRVTLSLTLTHSHKAHKRSHKYKIKVSTVWTQICRVSVDTIANTKKVMITGSQSGMKLSYLHFWHVLPLGRYIYFIFNLVDGKSVSNQWFTRVLYGLFNSNVNNAEGHRLVYRLLLRNVYETYFDQMQQNKNNSRHPTQMSWGRYGDVVNI